MEYVQNALILAGGVWGIVSSYKLAKRYIAGYKFMSYADQFNAELTNAGYDPIEFSPVNRGWGRINYIGTIPVNTLPKQSLYVYAPARGTRYANLSEPSDHNKIMSLENLQSFLDGFNKKLADMGYDPVVFETGNTGAFEMGPRVLCTPNSYMVNHKFAPAHGPGWTNNTFTVKPRGVPNETVSFHAPAPGSRYVLIDNLTNGVKSVNATSRYAMIDDMASATKSDNRAFGMHRTASFDANEKINRIVDLMSAYNQSSFDFARKDVYSKFGYTLIPIYIVTGSSLHVNKLATADTMAIGVAVYDSNYSVELNCVSKTAIILETVDIGGVDSQNKFSSSTYKSVKSVEVDKAHEQTQSNWRQSSIYA